MWFLCAFIEKMGALNADSHLFLVILHPILYT